MGRGRVGNRLHSFSVKIIKFWVQEQAGAVLGQAQLKLELELCFTSLKICFFKLIKLAKLSGTTFLNQLEMVDIWPIASNSISGRLAGS